MQTWGSAPWGAARASELATSLMDGGAFDATGISLGDKTIRFDAEQEAPEEAAAPAAAMPADILGDKEALDLVRSYYAIPENQRRRLFELARVLSDVA